MSSFERIFILNSKVISFVVLALIAMLTLTYSIPVMAFGGECEDKHAYSQAKTLDELIGQSEYIGLYYAKSVEKASEMKTGGHYQAQMYANHLTLGKSLTKNAPQDIVIYGANPEAVKIPSAYFYMKDLHQEIAEQDNLVMGQASDITAPDGSCSFSPRFVVGYSYLIFGGANSRAAYEPILHRKYDPLYREVVKRLRNKRATLPQKK